MDLTGTAALVSAVAGLGAVVGACVAGGYAKAAYDLERRRERGSALARQREDATKVVVWPAFSVEDQAYGVAIVNRSEAVMRTVEVRAWSQTFGVGFLRFRFLPPGTYFAASPWHGPARFPDAVDSLAGIRPVMSTDKYAASIAFNDPRGRRWQWSDAGELVELPRAAGGHGR